MYTQGGGCSRHSVIKHHSFSLKKIINFFVEINKQMYFCCLKMLLSVYPSRQIQDSKAINLGVGRLWDSEDSLYAKNSHRDKLGPIPSLSFPRVWGKEKRRKHYRSSVTPKVNSQRISHSSQTDGAQELSVSHTKSDILKYIIWWYQKEGSGKRSLVGWRWKIC